MFSALSSWLFPGNTDSFLLLLAMATSGTITVAFFFCRVVPVPGAYGAVPTADPDGNRLHRPKSGGNHHHSRRLHRHDDDQFGTNTTAAAAAAAATRLVGGKKQAPPPSPSPSPPPLTSPVAAAATAPNPEPNPDENSPLFSRSSEEEDEEGGVGEGRSSMRDSSVFASDSGAVLDGCSDPVHHLDIRGWALFRIIDFWLLFAVLGTLTGVGLMTIK